MWSFTTSIVLVSLTWKAIDAADSRFFGVPKSLRISLEDQRRVTMMWTFSRFQYRLPDETPFVRVQVDMAGRTRIFNVSVEESFHIIDLTENNDDFMLELKAGFEWLDGIKYTTSFRTVGNFGSCSAITRLELKQTMPVRYELSLESSRPQSLQKFSVTHCAPDCTETEFQRSGSSHLFFVSVDTDFTVAATAVYAEPQIDTTAGLREAICETNPAFKPSRINEIILAEHLEDKVAIKWRPPPGLQPFLTHYELYMRSENETTPGITFISNSTSINVFAPILMGPAFLVDLRAVYIDERGKQCDGSINVFRIPKYYPPIPRAVTMLTRGPRFIRFEITAGNERGTKRFKITVISPPKAAVSRTRDLGLIRELKPFTNVTFDVQQCYVQWQSHIEVCGPPRRSVMRTSVTHPSPVRVQKMVYEEDSRKYITWKPPLRPNGPIDGYRILIYGIDELGWKQEYPFDLEPNRRKFLFNHKKIASPTVYAVMAYNVDTDSNKRLYSKKEWIDDHIPTRIPWVDAGFTMVFMMWCVLEIIIRLCTPRPYNARLFQEEIERNFPEEVIADN